MASGALADGLVDPSLESPTAAVAAVAAAPRSPPRRTGRLPLANPSTGTSALMQNGRPDTHAQAPQRAQPMDRGRRQRLGVDNCRRPSSPTVGAVRQPHVGYCRIERQSAQIGAALEPSPRAGGRWSVSTARAIGTAQQTAARGEAVCEAKP